MDDPVSRKAAAFKCRTKRRINELACFRALVSSCTPTQTRSRIENFFYMGDDIGPDLYETIMTEEMTEDMHGFGEYIGDRGHDRGHDRGGKRY